MNKGAETSVVMAETETAQVPKVHTSTQPLEWSGVLAQQGYVFGVDISADGERVVLADLRGNVLGRDAHVKQSPDSIPHSPDGVIARVTPMMRDLLKKKGLKTREVLRIGVGFGGPVDSRLGLVRIA